MTLLLCFFSLFQLLGPRLPTPQAETAAAEAAAEAAAAAEVAERAGYPPPHPLQASYHDSRGAGAGFLSAPPTPSWAVRSD